MAWDIGDIISIQLKQTALGQEMANKLFFEIVTKDVGAIESECLSDVAEDLVNDMTLIQTPGVTHYEQVFLNESNGIDVFVHNYNTPGTASGANPAPSFLAIGYKKNVATRVTRPGSMRVGGVFEEAIEANAIAASWQTVVNNVGVFMGAVQDGVDSGTNHMTFQPVVVQRLPSGAVNPSVYQDVTSIANAKPTTQNSRKA